MSPGINKFVITAALCAVAGVPSGPLDAADADFSCMHSTVRGKTQVSDAVKEYDVILNNRCPGDVYWIMCIERIDPWTREVIEVHTPAGYLEAEKKSRVNLQMKRGPDERFRNRFQQMYVNVGYAIRNAAQVECVAARCEAQNRDTLRELQANERAWAETAAAMSNRIEKECPDTGWDTADRDQCKAEIFSSTQERMARFEEADQRLRERLARVSPEVCRVHAGDLVQD